MTHAVYPSLAGKTVVITGGGSGIGEVMVEGFVAPEVAGVLPRRRRQRVESAGRAAGRTACSSSTCDVTDIEALRAALADIEAKAGPVSVLVNNAANDDRHKFEEVTPAYWEQRIAVNLRHLFFGAQFVTPGMKKAGGGSIINLGSVSWHSAIAGPVDLRNCQGRHRGHDARAGARPRRVQHPRQLRGAGRHPHAAPDEALAHAGRRGQDPRAAVPQGARRSGPRHRHGAVPRLRRRRACALRTTTGWTAGYR